MAKNDEADTDSAPADNEELADKVGEEKPKVEDENADKDKQDEQVLTNDDTLDDTKSMETKAGAKLSKDTKTKLQGVYDGLEELRTKCEGFQGEIKAMLSDGDADSTKDDQTAAKKDVTAEASDEVQQTGDDDASSKDGQVDGEVNSGASGDANEGADQDGAEAKEDDEVVDPDNLTPEQAEKIAAAANAELDNLKQ